MSTEYLTKRGTKANGVTVLVTGKVLVKIED